VPLPRLYAAYRTPVFGSAGFDAMEVAVDLLGSGRGSRLYRTLVREQQVAQDVTTVIFPWIGGAAIFAVWATARPGVGHEALEAALWAEVDRLTAEGPTDDDLERVRNLHAAEVESGLESLAARAERLSEYACLFDQPERIKTEVSRYVSVDAARVREAMAASLRPDNRVVLIYVPATSPHVS
jgi:zinc protease